RFRLCAVTLRTARSLIITNFGTILQNRFLLVIVECRSLYLRTADFPLFEEKRVQPKIHRGRLNAEGYRFAVVVSRWNDFLTSKLLSGALDALAAHGAAEDAVEVIHVPGAFELPLAVLKAAETGRF